MSKVIVLGSVNMDLLVSSGRLPRPGETVTGTAMAFSPGGKGANQAVAAARGGAVVQLVGRVGDDPFGGELRSFLQDEGIDTNRLETTRGTPTGAALVVVDQLGENQIVVIPGANGELTPADVAPIDVAAGDVLVSQLEVPTATVDAFLTRGRDARALTLLNPAPARECPASVLAVSDVLVLNETELAFFTGVDLGEHTPAHTIADAARTVRADARQVVVVTLGGRGVIAVVGERTIDLAAQAVTAVDTTGAGDCFVGNLAAALAARESIERGLQLANAAASLCVQRPGAGPSMPIEAETRSAGAQDQ